MNNGSRALHLLRIQKNDGFQRSQTLRNFSGFFHPRLVGLVTRGSLAVNAQRPLPFGAGVIKRILGAFVPKPLRHLPAVFQIERFGYLVQLDLGVRGIDGFHFLGINPVPDTVSVTAVFLLVENDGTRLPLQSEFPLS